MAVALLAPTLVAAAALVAVETWYVVDPMARVFAPPAAQSLAEAIARQDVHQAYRFLVRGHHVDAPIEVQDQALTGGRLLRVTPIVWAVAVRNADAVQMLLGVGASLDGALEQRTPCLADAVGDARLAALLRRNGGAACSPLRSDRPPLAALVE